METDEEFWDLCLYVVNHTPKAKLARANLEAICREHLAGRHRITVVDLEKHPERARQDQIVAIPTVVRQAPVPERRVIGSLADAGRALKGLSMEPCRAN